MLLIPEPSEGRRTSGRGQQQQWRELRAAQPSLCWWRLPSLLPHWERPEGVEEAPGGPLWLPRLSDRAEKAQVLAGRTGLQPLGPHYLPSLLTLGGSPAQPLLFSLLATDPTVLPTNVLCHILPPSSAPPNHRREANAIHSAVFRSCRCKQPVEEIKKIMRYMN